MNALRTKAWSPENRKSVIRMVTIHTVDTGSRLFAERESLADEMAICRADAGYINNGFPIPDELI